MRLIINISRLGLSLLLEVISVRAVANTCIHGLALFLAERKADVIDAHKLQRSCFVSFLDSGFTAKQQLKLKAVASLQRNIGLVSPHALSLTA